MRITYQPHIILQNKINNTELIGSKRTFHSESYPCGNYAPAYFHPSFCAMKKNQFKNSDFIAVEKFKAPIEKFNRNEDLQNWAKDEYIKILKKKYGGKTIETRYSREDILDDWKDYVTAADFSNTQRLIILNGITKDLKKNNETLPRILNRRVLAETVNCMEKFPNSQFNFRKTYNNNLISFYYNDVWGKDNSPKWLKIPSKIHDNENFEHNQETLKTLSHRTWCTQSYKANDYLSYGDFHIYFENGKPKIGMRMVQDHIKEIQGIQNDGEIPDKYYDTINSYIDKENLLLGPEAVYEMNKCFERIHKAENISQMIKLTHGKNETEKLFNYLSIDFEKNEDGNYIIEDFSWECPVSFNKLNLTLKNPFENVVQVKKDVDLSNTNISSLGKIQEIGGDLHLDGNILPSLENIKINGKIYE